MMVPQPVLAVLLLFPITKESEEANKEGMGFLEATEVNWSRREW